MVTICTSALENDVFHLIVTMINDCVLYNINLFIGVDNINRFLYEMFFYFNFYNVRRTFVVLLLLIFMPSNSR
jgi:hypothetical protein